jgi:hypothetical protein
MSNQQFQERFSLEEMMEQVEPMIPVDVTPATQSLAVEIHPGKTLNINPNLDPTQWDQLVKVYKTIAKHLHGTIQT